MDVSRTSDRTQQVAEEANRNSKAQGEKSQAAIQGAAASVGQAVSQGAGGLGGAAGTPAPSGAAKATGA